MPVLWYVGIVYDDTDTPAEQDELDHAFILSFFCRVCTCSTLNLRRINAGYQYYESTRPYSRGDPPSIIQSALSTYNRVQLQCIDHLDSNLNLI